jgi:exosome complex component RRP42
MIETTKLTKETISLYLNEGKRFDGRKPGELREIVIETGVSNKAEGSARVKIGKTEVVVGVKMDAVEPFQDSSDEGILISSVETTPMSSSRFESGPPKFDSISMGRIVDRGLRESKFIDFSKLCIEEGKKVWRIYVDMYSINDDGNLLDAFALGALAAIYNAKIPEYNSETGKVNFGSWTDERITMTKRVPFTMTVHKIGNNFLIDPSKEEEDASETAITISLVDGPKISAIQKNGEAAISSEELGKILDLAQESWKSNYAKILKAIKDKS